MKPLILAALLVLAAITWWRSRSRMMRTVRLVMLSYLAIVVYRLATGVERDQLALLAGSLAFFVALWAISWLVTRVLAR